jgi:hypothetical protein
MLRSKLLRCCRTEAFCAQSSVDGAALEKMELVAGAVEDRFRESSHPRIAADSRYACPIQPIHYGDRGLHRLSQKSAYPDEPKTKLNTAQP